MKYNDDSFCINYKPIFKNKFPNHYVNDVEGWGIPKELIHSKFENGFYKLLTLDIDFGEKCSLSCPHCFRKSEELNTDSPPLIYKETIDIIKEAKKLGLYSLKILGAGEPFENKEFLKFLFETSAMGIKIAVFTKGHVLGSDALAKRYNAEYGIENCKELVQKIKDLNISILLGFNSFKKKIQDNFVGLKNIKWDHEDDFYNLRNKALINLIEAGFNEYIPGKPTRLALIAAPIKPENVDEIFDIYKWGRERNIYVVSCPTTYSGLGKNEFKKEQTETNFPEYVEKLKKLYTKIYLWNLKKNLMSLKTFIEDGVSLYPGAHPCNQVAAGMYITLRGKVIYCPGRDDIDFTVCNDIRENSLKDAWENSYNYKLAKTDKFNFYCIARNGIFWGKVHSFYNDIYNRVLTELGINN